MVNNTPNKFFVTSDESSPTTYRSPKMLRKDSNSQEEERVHRDDVCNDLLGQVKTLELFRHYATQPDVRTIPDHKEIRLFRGDIRLSDTDLRTRAEFSKVGKMNPKLKWPFNTVYYYINETSFTVTSNERRMIEKSIAFLEEETCLRFVHINPRARSNFHYIHVMEDETVDFCYSHLGYQHLVNPIMGNVQPLSLRRPSCFFPGTIQHEFLHALGVDHEQNRPDRDEHICVYYKNIRRNATNQFSKFRDTATFGLSYDFGSIMQYGNTFFGSKDKYGKLKITMLARKNPEICLGQNLKATQCDLEKVRAIYNCPMRKPCVPSERLPPCPPNQF